MVANNTARKEKPSFIAPPSKYQVLITVFLYTLMELMDQVAFYGNIKTNTGA